MTVTSWGYPGSIDSAHWSLMQYVIGHDYFISDEAAVRVTPVTTGTREVDIAAGYFGGCGVLDFNSDPFRLQLPTVTSGTEYFLIVARRTWGVTNQTTFAYIDAGTSAAIPSRATNPGTLDEQPIALVPLTAGQTVPGAPIDLRVIGHSKGGPYSAFSSLVLSYMDNVGTVIKIGSDTWTRIVNSSLQAVWVKDPGVYGRLALPTATGAGVIAASSGWTTGSPMVNFAQQDGNAFHIDLQARRTGAAIGTDSHGNIPDSQIGVLTAAYRPKRRLTVPTLLSVTYSSTDRTGYTSGIGLSIIDPNGNWTVVAAGPSVWLTPPTDTSVISVSASVDFLREDAS